MIVRELRAAASHGVIGAAGAAHAAPDAAFDGSIKFALA
jgi:hypothetical protein